MAENMLGQSIRPFPPKGGLKNQLITVKPDVIYVKINSRAIPWEVWILIFVIFSQAKKMLISLDFGAQMVIGGQVRWE